MPRGDAAAYDLDRIYAQFGDSEEALKWVSAAMRIHSLWLEWLKTGPLLDPLRKEPRFQAIERELTFSERRCNVETLFQPVEPLRKYSTLSR